MKTPSVTSTSSSRGGTARPASASRASSTAASVGKSPAERFTATGSGRPARAQAAAWRQAPSITARASCHAKPRLLGDRHEHIGRYRPALRMLPAHQRLEADKAHILQRVFRLIGQGDGIRLQRLAQIGFQRAAQGQSLRHLGGEGGDAGPALGLGGVHSDVGVLQGAFGAIRLRRSQHEADRGAGAQGDAADAERGSASAATMRRARPAASAASAPGWMTANSSPPSRASRSAGPSRARTRTAMHASSSRSPKAWPRVSFTSLKRSRSKQCSAQPAPAMA